MRTSSVAAAFLLLAGLCSARAAEVKITPLESSPGEIRSELREVLGTGFQVSIDGKATMELWPSKEIALRPQEKAILGAHYGQIVEGALVGLVRVPEKWMDFRGKPVAAGTYSLRYGVEPADGNHMGVSEYRDFLLLVPIASDALPKAVPERDALYSWSRKATGTNHPAVMSLVPVPEGSSLPSATSADGLVTASFKAGSLTLAAVVKGHAEK
jgi:hypothetical protein